MGIETIWELHTLTTLNSKYYILYTLLYSVSEISVVITYSGVPTVGQSYSLTCSVSGADYLNPNIVYQWFETGDPGVVLARSANLQLPPLQLTEDSHYTCQATISSPYLTEDLTFNQTLDVTIPSKLHHDL